MSGERDIVIIHYDYGGTYDIPYGRAQQYIDEHIGFTTQCLVFFNFDMIFNHGYEDVLVYKNNGSFISAMDLLKNDGYYTDKEIRKEHNIMKMLVAGCFTFKKRSHQTDPHGLEHAWRIGDNI
jgi:hypothetical protein